MKKQAKLTLLALLGLGFLFLLGCGTSIDSGETVQEQPARPVAGKAFLFTIFESNKSEGPNKVLPDTGTFTVTFSSTANTYEVNGDGTNVPKQTRGTYTYDINGNQGLATVDDSTFPNLDFILTFTSDTGGSFRAATQSSFPYPSNQTGIFNQVFQ